MRVRVVMAAGLVLMGMAGMASAVPISILNGSFETGDFNGWTTTGGGGQSVVSSVGVLSTTFSPTDGDYLARLIADSTLTQGVSWDAGDAVSFDWNFIALDFMPYNDYSIFEVRDSGGSPIFGLTLADVAGTVPGGQYQGYTGWNNYSYTFDSEGSGSIAFGVYDVLGGTFSSQLLIDNVVATPVPEPFSMMMLGCLGAGMLGARKLRRKQSK